MNLDELKEQLKTEQSIRIKELEETIEKQKLNVHTQANKIRSLNREDGNLKKDILSFKDTFHKINMEPKIVLDDTKKDEMLKVLASRCYVFLGSKGICNHCGFSELCPKHITGDAFKDLTGSSKLSAEGIDILAVLGSEANE